MRRWNSQRDDRGTGRVVAVVRWSIEDGLYLRLDCLARIARRRRRRSCDCKTTDRTHSTNKEWALRRGDGHDSASDLVPCDA